MRKGSDGGEKNGGGEKQIKKKKRMMKIMATNAMSVGPTGTPTTRAK